MTKLKNSDRTSTKMARSKALIGFLAWCFVLAFFLLALAICAIGIDERTSRHEKNWEDAFPSAVSGRR